MVNLYLQTQINYYNNYIGYHILKAIINKKTNCIFSIYFYNFIFKRKSFQYQDRKILHFRKPS